MNITETLHERHTEFFIVVRAYSSTDLLQASRSRASQLTSYQVLLLLSPSLPFSSVSLAGLPHFLSHAVPIAAQCLVLFVQKLRPIRLGTHRSSMPGLVHPEVKAHPSRDPSQLNAWSCLSTTHGPSILGPTSAQCLVLFVQNSGPIAAQCLVLFIQNLRPIHPGAHLSSKPGLVHPQLEAHPSRDPSQLKAWSCSSKT